MCGWRRISFAVIASQRVGHGEVPRVGADLREEDAFEDQIADLAAQRVGVAAVDRVEDLVRLLEHEARAATRASVRDPRGSPAGRAAAP